MNFHVVTLFPVAFDSYLGESIMSRAIKDNKIKVKFYNPRDFADNKLTKSAKGGSSDQRRWFRRHIDQKPYSGGPGMVIQALPVVKAIEAALKIIEKRKKVTNSKVSKVSFDTKRVKIIWFSPGGKQFDTEYAKKTVHKFTDIILISGRYEGIDARVQKIFSASSADSPMRREKLDQISIGPFVLTGGELPAMIVIDCMARQVEGVLGNFNSLEESRVSSHDVYTRPEVFEYKGKKYRVPKVLLSGDHKKIEAWKNKK